MKATLKTAGPRAPQKRDPERTRQRILECAAHCFAASGFKGTSLSEILEKAHVNKRMVYHYFGSKEGLYKAVHLQEWQALENWFAKALSESAENGSLSLGHRELLLRAVRIFHEFTGQNQIFLRLLMWDGLEGGIVSRSIWKDIRGPIYHRIEALVLEAQRQGVLASDLRADHLIVSFMGIILFYFASGSSLTDIFKRDPLSPEAIAERNVQVLALFEHTLLKQTV